tara:strand:+ start:937 stop:1425 length:489 start_codon:yes stop_codon:yes gene_type:complete
MKKLLLSLISIAFISCQQKQNNLGIFKDDDSKSEVVVKLADSYLAGNFDMAREYFSTDSKHLFNNLEFDVDGIIDGYNSHSLIFKDIKHNERKVYTGYYNDGSIQTYHDFNWSATSIITGKEYNYPCHCRWVWENNKIISTTCYVDPAAIFEEAAIFAESQN